MSKRPNIVYLFCDELRCDALSCYPDAPKGIHTRNLDRLAAMGTLFERCYCNSPVCVPSRYSIMTGLYPETTGVYHNEAAMKGYKMENKFLTIPEVLEKHGYLTADFGKQHLPVGVSPFMHSDPSGSKIALEEAWRESADIFGAKGLAAPLGGIYPSQIPYPPGQVTKHALAWMKQQKEAYMVRISYLQPHTPVIVPQPYASVYEGAEFPKKDRADASLSAFECQFAHAVDDSNLSERQVHLAKARYYGLVRWLDDQIGEILKYLEESHQLNDTIILFGADHGAMLGENHRYGKQNFSRWSHNVPLFISYPERIKAGQRRKELCENVDIGKTLFSLLDIKAPRQFQGIDLFSDSPVDYVFGTIGYGEQDSFAFPYKKYGAYTGGRGWPRRACIRSGDFRLDMNVRIDGEAAKAEDEDIFLADTVRDPLEQYNLAKKREYFDMTTQLKQRLRTHILKEYERGRKLC